MTTVFSEARPPGRPPLARPTRSRYRRSIRTLLVRHGWRRLVLAVLAGLLAGSGSLAGLSRLTARSETDQGLNAVQAKTTTAGTTGSDPNGQAAHPGETRVGDDERILAVSVEAVRLPVAIGDRIELVGLEPALATMEAEVIADDARVVGFTDEDVLMAVKADEAYRAAEFEAVGALTALGRSLPNPSGRR